LLPGFKPFCLYLLTTSLFFSLFPNLIPFQKKSKVFRHKAYGYKNGQKHADISLQLITPLLLGIVNILFLLPER